MITQNQKTNLEIARQYIALFNETPIQAEKFKTFVDPDITWQEMPNTFSPSGRTGGLALMLAGLERGNVLLKDQRYLIQQAVGDGDRVALEIIWEGCLAQQAGPFPPDTQLRANVGIILTFRAGKITSQHDYPCYHPIKAGNREIGD
jgi:ketosteroid isomerase-like protein